jgi:arsenate reductase
MNGNAEYVDNGFAGVPTIAVPKVLFLCTGNSCRSQMAEGWTRALKADSLDAYSAGTQPRALDPLAVSAMAEAGVDISRYRSKHISELADVAFDIVVTVCGHANETCPIFAGGTVKLHRGFDDPPQLAMGAKSEEQALAYYRRVRDQIRAWVSTLPESLEYRYDPLFVE